REHARRIQQRLHQLVERRKPYLERRLQLPSPEQQRGLERLGGEGRRYGENECVRGGRSGDAHVLIVERPRLAPDEMTPKGYSGAFRSSSERSSSRSPAGVTLNAGRNRRPHSISSQV